MPDFSPLTIRHIQLSSYRIWFLLIFLFIHFFCVYNVCCVIRTIDCVSKTHFQSLRTEKIDEEKRKQQKNQPTGYLNSQTLSFSLTVFMRWISFLFIFFFHFIKSTKMMECRCWVSISLTIDAGGCYVCRNYKRIRYWLIGQRKEKVQNFIYVMTTENMNVMRQSREWTFAAELQLNIVWHWRSFRNVYIFVLLILLAVSVSISPTSAPNPTS